MSIPTSSWTLFAFLSQGMAKLTGTFELYLSTHCKGNPLFVCRRQLRPYLAAVRVLLAFDRAQHRLGTVHEQVAHIYVAAFTGAR